MEKINKCILYFIIKSKDGSNTILKKDCEDNISVYSFGAEQWVSISKLEDVIIDGDVLCEIPLLEVEKVLNEQRDKLNHLVEVAMSVANDAHKGQYDKGGKPYILHPLAVANSLNDTEQKIIAYLHDVCEDTSITLSDLANLGFTSHILYALKLLTKQKGIPYMEYIKGIKTNRNAIEVKKSDLCHNMDLSRIPNPSEKDKKRVEKYKKALSYLIE